jgi:uncharacterized protein YjbI with pentapeptide repeats
LAGPDIKNIEALPGPFPGAEAPASEPDTKNLDALLASLNTSAERFQTLWFSFLGLTLYFAIAALTTTHKDLLLGEPQSLPILNIKVPLLPFYVIAPLLYWVFHFYLLMMLVLLTRTAAEFDEQLRSTIRDETERERYRARVENALFLQLFIGMKGERSGVNALLLATIAIITIVLAPLATMVLMQMRFLPYHHFRITWGHRGFVLADVFLIVIMTSPVIYSRGVTRAPVMAGALGRRSRWLTVATVYTLVTLSLLPLACWLSLKEGRWAGEPWPSFHQWRWWAGEPLQFETGKPDYESTKNGVVFGLFPDRLILWNEILVGETRLEGIKKEIASRNGDFIPTINLEYRDLQGALLNDSDRRGVSFLAAAMQGATLSSTRLDGASLFTARLQGADLRNAQLQGADLSSAQLQGADLEGAQLQGARLYSAQLSGADLRGAQLQGATLQRALLQGADLRHTRLQGADLSRAQLQGADLGSAQLQGAALRFARLQGASLEGANLTDSEFEETSV